MPDARVVTLRMASAIASASELTVDKLEASLGIARAPLSLLLNGVHHTPENVLMKLAARLAGSPERAGAVLERGAATRSTIVLLGLLFKAMGVRHPLATLTEADVVAVRPTNDLRLQGGHLSLFLPRPFSTRQSSGVLLVGRSEPLQDWILCSQIVSDAAANHTKLLPAAARLAGDYGLDMPSFGDAIQGNLERRMTSPDLHTITIKHSFLFPMVAIYLSEAATISTKQAFGMPSALGY